jgi:hypothetical protein
LIGVEANMNQISYRRVQHAAHYGYSHPAKGHDLEQWDVVAELARGVRSGHPVAPAEVPADAEYHSGYRRDGVQHWIFVRRAPLTGSCPHCSVVVAS